MLFSRRYHEYPRSWVKNALEHETKDSQEALRKPSRIDAVHVLVTHRRPQVDALVIVELELVVGIQRAEVVDELVRIHPSIGHKLLQVLEVLPHAFLTHIIEHDLLLVIYVLAYQAIE